MSKHLMVTRCDSGAEELAQVTHPILKSYAKIWKADFMKLDYQADYLQGYGMGHYRIMKLYDLLDEYDRILMIDSDVLIMPSCPNIFDVVPKEMIGTIYEDKGSRAKARSELISAVQRKFGDVGWSEGYINTGVFVVSKKHKDIFQTIDGEYWRDTGFDDVHLGYNIHRLGFEVAELSYKFNHMSMFSESWNNRADRFNSYIIHYAGQAAFNGHHAKSNKLSDRLELIKSDIDTVRGSMLEFKDTKALEKQGSGWSCVFSSTCKLGHVELEVMLKVQLTFLENQAKEQRTLELGIPHIVELLGMCDKGEMGKFLILEKLKELPEVISEDLMKEIARGSLIALRQLYKHNITWICKLDHIMLDKRNKVKLIDFNDEDCPKIPFYGQDESIIMDGYCQSNGVYAGKDETPQSGWIACMKHLCLENVLSWTIIILDAVHAMVENEYQSLKNVHQPIYFPPYQGILRRETERPDPNYGKLVKPNRECRDRGTMIFENLAKGNKEKTCLDIGCNVGWFSFYLEDMGFKVTGIDADKDMVEFATMLAQKERTKPTFRVAEITPEYAESMPSYDIILALSALHWSLIKPPDGSSQISIGEGTEYFLALLGAVCSKVTQTFFFEFPPYAYSALKIHTTVGFINIVEDIGKFKNVDIIGVSDARRPVLKCSKQ